MWLFGLLTCKRKGNNPPPPVPGAKVSKQSIWILSCNILSFLTSLANICSSNSLCTVSIISSERMRSYLTLFKSLRILKSFGKVSEYKFNLLEKVTFKHISLNIITLNVNYVFTVGWKQLFSFTGQSFPPIFIIFMYSEPKDKHSTRDGFTLLISKQKHNLEGKVHILSFLKKPLCSTIASLLPCDPSTISSVDDIPPSPDGPMFLL